MVSLKRNRVSYLMDTSKSCRMISPILLRCQAPNVAPLILNPSPIIHRIWAGPTTDSSPVSPFLLCLITERHNNKWVWTPIHSQPRWFLELVTCFLSPLEFFLIICHNLNEVENGWYTRPNPTYRRWNYFEDCLYPGRPELRMSLKTILIKALLKKKKKNYYIRVRVAWSNNWSRSNWRRAWSNNYSRRYDFRFSFSK